MTLAESFARQLMQRILSETPPLPNLYDKQLAFVMSDAHHAAFVAGIGSGKSWSGAVRAHRAAMGWVGDTKIPTPNLGVVTAPTYDMLRDATLRTFREIAGSDVTSFNKNEMTATLKNGSEIIFRSTQYPDRLRGPSISWWWGDEAALYTPDVRKIMVGRMRQFGLLGYDWVTTTPRGRNWVWQTFVKDVPVDGRDDYLLMKASSRENTFLDPSIVDTWEQEYTGDFAAQELNAEFVAFEGLIYSEFDRVKHVSTRMPEYSRHIAGVDWGFANPGVIIVAGIDGDGQIGIVREVYQRQMRIDEWVEVAVQLRDIFRIETFYCDPANPDNIKAFVSAGLAAQPAINTVQTGIQAVKNRLAQPNRFLITHDAINLMDEFESYQWAKNQYGVRDEPLKTKDHAMDALRYLIMGLDKKPKMKRVEVRTQRYA